MSILDRISRCTQNGSALVISELMPDHGAEVYYKAADALILPYKHVYPSGFLFEAGSFGLPVLAAGVGSLSDEIVPAAFRGSDRSQYMIAYARVLKVQWRCERYNLEPN